MNIDNKQNIEFVQKIYAEAFAAAINLIEQQVLHDKIPLTAGLLAGLSVPGTSEENEEDNPEALRKNIGARLAMFRKLRGITQVSIAQQLGIHKSMLSNYEAGRSEPPFKHFVKICRILNVSADAVLGLK